MNRKNPKIQKISDKQISRENSKMQTNLNSTNSKRFDLEERCLLFSRQLLVFCKTTTKTISNIEIVKQLVRSGTSIGANYLEANDALGKKDFLHRLRISRKEAKETI